MKKKIEEMEIFRNERPEPNVFKNKYDCDFCDDFISQVIFIDNHIFICAGCLQKMIDRLNKNMVDNFQKDFEASRKGE